MNKELFFAKAGKGAFLNGKRIHCSNARDLARTEGISQLQFLPMSLAFLEKLLASRLSDHFAITTYNCFAVNACYVAAGRKDWVFAPYGQIHDYAAPSLILKESGCKTTTLQGDSWRLSNQGLLAANPVLHKQLLKLTKNV